MSLDLLKKALKHEGTLAKVSAKSGAGRTALSLILSNKYPSSPDKVLAKIRSTYDFLESTLIKCPALKDEIHPNVCKRYKEAVKAKKELGGITFVLVRETCPYCPNY